MRFFRSLHPCDPAGFDLFQCIDVAVRRSQPTLRLHTQYRFDLVTERVCDRDGFTCAAYREAPGAGVLHEIVIADAS